MTIHEHHDKPHSPAVLKPCAMVGAGRLVSTIWKTGNQLRGWRYHFNLFRMSSRGRVRQRFDPADVLSLVKIAKVLAAELANDGCLAPEQRSELTHLATVLDQIFQSKD